MRRATSARNIFGGVASGFIAVAILTIYACQGKPDWVVKNEKLIREKNLSGRTRTDIPERN
jgi:hypothetical protein